MWVFAGLVPAALAAVALAVRRAGQTGVRGVLVATLACRCRPCSAPACASARHDVDGALAALGAGLDTVAVALAAITAGTLLRPRRARRLSVVAAIVGVVVATRVRHRRRHDEDPGSAAGLVAAPGAVAVVPR